MTRENQKKIKSILHSRFIEMFNNNLLFESPLAFRVFRKINPNNKMSNKINIEFFSRYFYEPIFHRVLEKQLMENSSFQMKISMTLN